MGMERINYWIFDRFNSVSISYMGMDPKNDGENFLWSINLLYGYGTIKEVILMTEQKVSISYAGMIYFV